MRLCETLFGFAHLAVLHFSATPPGGRPLSHDAAFADSVELNTRQALRKAQEGLAVALLPIHGSYAIDVQHDTDLARFSVD